MELFDTMAGIKMNHVPYKGSAASYVDLLSGRVSAEFDVLPTSMQHTKSGKLIPLAVGSAKRVPQLPNVPTVAESGVPGYESSSWYGFVAPANLPKDILDKLNKGIVQALKSASLSETLDQAGVIVVASTPEEFGDHIKKEMTKASKIIKEANIKAD
jgi:tripartite-type tricarboxylate transporter receptor subunit TctC